MLYVRKSVSSPATTAAAGMTTTTTTTATTAVEAAATRRFGARRGSGSGPLDFAHALLAAIAEISRLLRTSAADEHSRGGLGRPAAGFKMLLRRGRRGA
jgi:hypothetical protein